MNSLLKADGLNHNKLIYALQQEKVWLKEWRGDERQLSSPVWYRRCITEKPSPAPTASKRQTTWKERETAAPVLSWRVWSWINALNQTQRSEVTACASLCRLSPVQLQRRDLAACDRHCGTMNLSTWMPMFSSYLFSFLVQSILISCSLSSLPKPL